MKRKEYLEKISPKIAKDIEKFWFRSRSRDLCKFLEGFAFAFGDFDLGKGTSPWGRHQQEKTFSGGHCPNKGGGVYPCPDFWAPFFCQVTVLKMAIFYSNFTVIVCFLSHFCHNYHQNYQNYHHNYH